VCRSDKNGDEKIASDQENKTYCKKKLIRVLHLEAKVTVQIFFLLNVFSVDCLASHFRKQSFGGTLVTGDCRLTDSHNKLALAIELNLVRWRSSVTLRRRLVFHRFLDPASNIYIFAFPLFNPWVRHKGI